MGMAVRTAAALLLSIVWISGWAPAGLAGEATFRCRGTLHFGDALARAATREDGLANWSSEGKLQWCAGAPGVVSAARDYLDEELLLAGAGLVWRAGPPGGEKGHGICHGTSGNGFALLAAFERTQDEVWLGRARRFAMHALAQAKRMPGRYSLFTGGAGTALFAAACLDGDARYPVLERNRRTH